MTRLIDMTSKNLDLACALCDDDDNIATQSKCMFIKQEMYSTDIVKWLLQTFALEMMCRPSVYM